MKIRRHFRWILPLTVFFLFLTPFIVGRRYGSVARYYRKAENRSCGLARGYAREFESKTGHAPSDEEFKAWTISRFSEDLQKMRVDDKGNVDWLDRQAP